MRISSTLSLCMGLCIVSVNIKRQMKFYLLHYKKNLSAFGQSLNINTMYMNVAYCLDTVLSNEDCTPQCYLYTVSDTSCSVGKRPGDEL